MFCALTNQLVKKKPESLQEHLKGKRFKKAQGTGPTLFIFV